MPHPTKNRVYVHISVSAEEAARWRAATPNVSRLVRTAVALLLDSGGTEDIDKERMRQIERMKMALEKQKQDQEELLRVGLGLSKRRRWQG